MSDTLGHARSGHYRAGPQSHAGGAVAANRLQRLRARWARAEPFAYPPRDGWPVALRRARTAGFLVLGIQLVALGWWSSVLVHRFALTPDFSSYQQAAFLIGHGDLNPYSTVLRERFWRNDTELIIWLLALVARAWPHLTALPWTQDLALVGAEAVALNWICDITAARAHREPSDRLSIALVVLGVLLLAGNPWTWWTASFDFHLEALATLFLLCAAKNLYTGRARAWVWVALALSCGSVGASYVFALGIAALLLGRCWLRQAGGMAAIGVLWLGFLQAVHGAQAAGVLEYGFLYWGRWGVKVPRGLSGGSIAIQTLEHPWRVFVALWRNKVNLWANVSPAGAIGFLWLPLSIPALLVAAEGGLSTPLFSHPGFQSIALATLVAIGTVALLARIPIGQDLRRRRLLVAAITLLGLNSVAWSIVWLPDVGRSWLVVSSPAASVLQRVRGRIGPGDEVVSSYGVIGGFADRRYVYLLQPNARTVPTKAHTVWIIVAPSQGIEPSGSHGYYAEMQTLDANPRVHLVAAGQGIWAYRFNPSPRERLLTIGGARHRDEPAWTLTGAAGKSVKIGPRADWYATSTGREGYVIDRSYWREQVGVYEASVALAVKGTATVEVWNSDTDTLLARTILRGGGRRRVVTLRAPLAAAPPAREQHGWGIWRITPQEPDGDSLEIRVWTPGGGNRVRVYGLALAKDAGGG